jgi:hypothetical protein
MNIGIYCALGGAELFGASTRRPAKRLLGEISPIVLAGLLYADSGLGAEAHSHEREHDPFSHSHAYYPDIHHRHSH